LIERAVILSEYGVLPNPLLNAETQRIGVSQAPTTLLDSERTLILRHACGSRMGNWRTRWRSRQAWLEAHYADLQDAEARDFSAVVRWQF